MVIFLLYNFKTQFDQHDRIFTNPGCSVHKTYSPRFDDFGHFELVESGEVDIYDEIQSHADSVDIHILLKRYAEGDVSALARVQGSYFDATQFPRTYAEVLNSLIDAENVFMSLPVEERAKYDHSFQVWLSSLDFSGDAPSSDVPVPEVTPNPDNVSPAPASAPAPDSSQN